jgi:prolyl-tRNA synthetase
MNKNKTAINPTRQENYSEWYQEVIKDLAESSPVRGCMIIKPWGYAIWEEMQKTLDSKFKETGHQNAYFPLFIPLSFLQKEADHVDGFAKECAVVTHHKLKQGTDGKLIPSDPLEEPLIIRPTSETLIGDAFSRWISSYRDLPILINQWCNIVRWEMRTRMFLRTTEILWQEGHTAHATRIEAMDETMQMLNVYAEFAEKTLAIPVIKGEKTPSETFPGAVNTYTIEAMMQDRKAIQMGTSHFLGQSFAKAFSITFRNQQETQEHAWTTSWGVTTRMIGSLIMTHSDDNGIVLPPKIAPVQIVIIPVIHKEEFRSTITHYCDKLASELGQIEYNGKKITVVVDKKEMRGGDKVWAWIKKGVPIRIEIGPRDIEKDLLPLRRRDKTTQETSTVSRSQLLKTIKELLQEIQDSLFERALAHRDSNCIKIDNKDEFYNFFTPQNQNQPEIHGGFALSHWSGETDVEDLVKKELGVTIRCIPLEGEKEQGRCIITGKKSCGRVVYAKAY